MSLQNALDEGKMSVVTTNEQRAVVKSADRFYSVFRYYFCSCESFFVRNVGRGSLLPCKHLLYLLYHDVGSHGSKLAK
ncbi:MAG: hypothetical protein QXI37_01390 [Thermoprotei archaeon]